MTQEKTLDKLLDELDACEDAREWARDKSLGRAWAECERSDWMLWLAARMIGKPGWPTHQEIVSIACACARRALAHIPSGEDRPRLAIEAAEAWAADPTEERRDAAGAAARAAGAAARAAWAAGAAGAAVMSRCHSFVVDRLEARGAK